MEDYIDYLETNHIPDMENRIKMCKRYIQYYDYNEYVNNRCLKNKPYIVEIFTYPEMYYSDYIVQFIYDSQNKNLYNKLHQIIKKVVYLRIKWVKEMVDPNLNPYFLKFKTKLHEELNNGYNINIHIIDDKDDSVSSLIQKYK